MIFLKQKSPKHPTLSWLPSYKIDPPICKIIHPTMLTVCNSAQWDSMVCVRTGKQWEGENQSIHRGVSYRAWACESKTRSGPVGAFCSQFSLHSSFKRPHMKAMWKISEQTLGQCLKASPLAAYLSSFVIANSHYICYMENEDLR